MEAKKNKMCIAAVNPVGATKRIKLLMPQEDYQNFINYCKREDYPIFYVLAEEIEKNILGKHSSHVKPKFFTDYQCRKFRYIASLFL